jgi:hypothetical protein
MLSNIIACKQYEKRERIRQRIFTKDELYGRDRAASRRKWTAKHAAVLRLTGKSSEHPGR